MDVKIKILAFEYYLTQMLRWGDSIKPTVPHSSFTRLKALKLLFFTAAVKNKNGLDLLDIFDNFYALRNGPVESDVYNYITEDLLTYYSFQNFYLHTKKQYSDIGLDNDLKCRIDDAIASLRLKNDSIVAYSAESLVTLSHAWKAWQRSIQVAHMLGKGSYQMNVDRIRANEQIFTIWQVIK